ncbi:hypothetical protein DL767_009378 [Monosporascus sp. MG133]|nr:hypothetical protein DL767_009378 [Monosporascus sp. MG133]
MEYDFKKWWEHLKTHMVSRVGDATTLSRLRAAAKFRLVDCDPESLTLQFLQYQINGDLYRSLTGSQARVPPPNKDRLPYEPKIEKEILLRLVTDENVGLDALARAIGTNGKEYDMGTRNVAASPATTPHTAVANRVQGSEAGNQATSALLQPLAQHGGLADSRWAPGNAGAKKPRAQQPQTAKTGTRKQASELSKYPGLPSSQAPLPTSGQPRLANLSAAQAVPIVTTQSLQQDKQREIETKMNLLGTKAPDLQSVGGAPWQILLPRSVDPMGSIKPYHRAVEDILGVNLIIKSDRLEVGQSILQLGGRPSFIRAAVQNNRRASAYCDLAAYVRFSCDTGAAPDIVEFLLARQVDIFNRLRTESVRLGGTEEAILGSTVAPPVAPHGEYLRYSAEHAKPREGQASNAATRLQEEIKLLETAAQPQEEIKLLEKAARAQEEIKLLERAKRPRWEEKLPTTTTTHRRTHVHPRPRRHQEHRPHGRPPRASTAEFNKFSRAMDELLGRRRSDHETRERAAALKAESSRAPEETGNLVLTGPPSKTRVTGLVGGVARVKCTDTLTMEPAGGEGADQGAGKQAGGEGAEQGAGTQAGDEGADQGAGKQAGDEGADQGAGKQAGGEGAEQGAGKQAGGDGADQGAESNVKGKGSPVQPESKEVPSRAKSQK